MFCLRWHCLWDVWGLSQGVEGMREERRRWCLALLWNEDKVIVMIHAVKWFVTAGWGDVRVSVRECYSQLLQMTANSLSYGTWALALGIFMVHTNHRLDALFLLLRDESKIVNHMDTWCETCRLIHNRVYSHVVEKKLFSHFVNLYGF